MERIDITAFEGIHIGHAEDLVAATGCTVVLCPKGAVCGVDVRGGSPGTRDTDALNPINNRKCVHGILLAGGSSFGLAAIGQNGIARTVRPAHSVFDGDTIFSLCTGDIDANFDAIGILAARAVEAAILDAVTSAETLHGFISYKNFTNSL